MAHDITTPSDGNNLFGGIVRNSNPNATNRTDNTIVFYVRVLNNPISISATDADMLLRDSWIAPPYIVDQNNDIVPDPTHTSGGQVNRPRIMFRGRILRASNGLRPHIFLKDPCRIDTTRRDRNYVNRIISEHTLFVSHDGNFGLMPSFGDVVLVKLGVSDFNGPELKVSTFDEIASMSDSEMYSFDRDTDCATLSSIASLGSAAVRERPEYPAPPYPTGMTAIQPSFGDLIQIQRYASGVATEGNNTTQTPGAHPFQELLFNIRHHEAGAQRSAATCEGDKCVPYGVYNLGSVAKALPPFREMCSQFENWVAADGSITSADLPPELWLDPETGVDVPGESEGFGGVDVYPVAITADALVRGGQDLHTLYVDNVLQIQGLNGGQPDIFTEEELDLDGNSGTVDDRPTRIFTAGAYQFIPDTLENMWEKIYDNTAANIIREASIVQYEMLLYPAKYADWRAEEKANTNHFINAQRFDVETQDRLCIYMILADAGSRGDFKSPLGNFIFGFFPTAETKAPTADITSSDPTARALNVTPALLWAGQSLAYVWAFAPIQFNTTLAAYPDRKRGQSAYDGVGGNRSSSTIDPGTVLRWIYATHREVMQNGVFVNYLYNKYEAPAGSALLQAYNLHERAGTLGDLEAIDGGILAL